MYINFNHTVSGKKDTRVQIAVTLQDLSVLSEIVHTQTMKTINKNWKFTLKKYTRTSVLFPFILHHWKYDKFDKAIAKTSGCRFFQTLCRKPLSIQLYFCNYDVEQKSLEINLNWFLIGCNWPSSIFIATVMLTMVLCLQIAEEILRLD